MIAKFLSKYGLATHLAVLAALPLALTPFLTAATLGSVILWLSALAAVSLLIEPSLRVGEHLSLARARVRREIIRDPLFWLLLLFVVFTFIRWVNSGIGLFYEAEVGKWSVKTPKWGILPGSVEDAGYLPFAVSVAVSLLLVGIRHGIGLMARTAFGLTASFLTGLGGLVAVGCAAGCVLGAEGWMTATLGEVPFWPSFFGVWLILGVVCGVQAEAAKWGIARMLVVVALAGNSAALLFFAPPLVAAVWFLLAIVVAAFSLSYLGRAASMGAVARNLSLLVVGFTLPIFIAMTFMPQEIRASKMRHLSPASAIEPRRAEVKATLALNNSSSMLDGRKKAEKIRKEEVERSNRGRTILNDVARRMWQNQPWTGAGIGAFGIQTRFIGQDLKINWRDIPPKPTFTPNSYWMHLSERGILGCALVVMLIALLVVSYFARMIGAFGYLRKQDDVDIFAFAVGPMAWVAPLCVLPVLVEAVYTPLFLSATFIIILTVPLALSAATFPKPKKPVAPESSEGDASGASTSASEK